MTLTTTVGGAASDSYATLAEFEAYAASMGWAIGGHGHDDGHEANLRRAAVVIDTYRFLGMRQYQAQAREWPRIDLPLIDGWPVNPDTIPQAVKNAQIELAWLIHEGADPLATVEGVIASTRSKVGPIEEDIAYQGGKALPRFTAVDRLLRSYLAGGGGVRLVRA